MPKIKLLYITHGSNDFMDDQLFMGLHKFEDIFDIYYYLSDSEKGKPKNIYERSENIEYSWKDTWLHIAKRYKPWDKNLIYDVCIVGQIWPQNQDAFFEIQSSLSSNVRTTVIDAVDDGGPQYQCRVPCDIMFYNNIINNFYELYTPLSCPYELAYPQNNDKIEYSINCQLGLTSPTRFAMVDFINQYASNHGIQDAKISLWKDGKIIIGQNDRTPTDKYWSVLNKSRIIVHDRGTGFDAYRFWEGMATGNIVLCSPNNVYIVNKMPLPPNVWVWNNINELCSLLDRAMSYSQEDMMNLRKESKKFILDYHLPHHRLEKIFHYLGISIK